MAEYSVQKEADRIFREVLLADERLQVPAKVAALAEHTTFDAPGTLDTPYLPVALKMTETSAALWALAATFGHAIVQERRGGPDAAAAAEPQRVRVNTDLATLTLASFVLARVDGKPLSDGGLARRFARYDLHRFADPYRRLCTNIYRTRDGRFFQMHGSLNADRPLAVLGLPADDAALAARADDDATVQVYAAAVARVDAGWLDDELNEHARQAGAPCATEAEFRASPQGRAIAGDGLYLLRNEAPELPPVPYPRLDTTKAEEDAPRARPLEGLRLLDLSRVIAGPTIAKLAAAFGATVVRVSCAAQPDVGMLLVDGNLGKRDASLDLKTAAGRAALKRLLADADVVLDGYRPGALERLGFGAAYLHALARRRGRGYVVVRENCYGWHGPLARRPGWQQVTDSATGVAWAQGRFLGLDEPVLPPLPNSDYQTGLAGLVGLLAAVDRRASAGGSYTVDTSLHQYNQFLLAQGPLPPAAQERLRRLLPADRPMRHFHDMGRLGQTLLAAWAAHAPQLLHTPAYFGQIASRFGADDGREETLTYVRPAVDFDGITRLGYDVGSCFLDAYPPEWPA